VIAPPELEDVPNEDPPNPDEEEEDDPPNPDEDPPNPDEEEPPNPDDEGEGTGVNLVDWGEPGRGGPCG